MSRCRNGMRLRNVKWGGSVIVEENVFNLIYNEKVSKDIDNQ